MIIFGRLPGRVRPRDSRRVGRFIARGDLVYVEFKRVVEYDGWRRERDGRQHQRDMVRGETLEAAHWRLIVVTSEDLRDKREVIRRIHAGAQGPRGL